jgi:hypothetical protein
MLPYVKLVVCLPDEAAEQLADLALQQRSTISGFVADVIENWLEQRRKDVRLGRKNQAQSKLRAAAADGTRVD